MPVLFFDKSMEYQVPEGFKKFSPRTRQQKLQYKIDLLKVLASGKPSLSPKNLEELDQLSEKLLLENSLNIYTMPNSSMNENMGEYTAEEIFAPENYGKMLNEPVAKERAEKKIMRNTLKANILNLTGKIEALPTNNGNRGRVANNSSINILSAIQRQHNYLKIADALKAEAVAVLRSNADKDMKARARKQYDMGKAYEALAKMAIEGYQRNLQRVTSYKMGGRKGSRKNRGGLRKTRKNMRRN
jgi:hypothetical protein